MPNSQANLQKNVVILLESRQGDEILKFPNAVVLNVVGRREMQMSGKERKRKNAKERNKGAKERFRVKIANNQV